MRGEEGGLRGGVLGVEDGKKVELVLKNETLVVGLQPSVAGSLKCRGEEMFEL